MADITPTLLAALELDKNGDWDAAHTIVQSLEDTRAYWIHAYLHRKEGDLGNAGYWYDRAGHSLPDVSLDQEWQTLNQAIRG